MNWKKIWGILGLFITISYGASTIYQLINWDNNYWTLIQNIAFTIVGISLIMDWRKNHDSDLMTDAEEKQVYQKGQDKKENNSIS